MEKGSLSNVREQLSSSLDKQFDENQKEEIRRAFDQAGITDQYESAGESFGISDALASAAQSGNLGDAYSAVYQRDPSLREALSEAASSAFDTSSREAIADLASERNLDEAYKHCAMGDAEAAAQAIGVNPSNFNPSSTNECNNMVANMAGYSETLFNAYKDSDDSSTFVESEYEA